jgi:hypothetical protein
LLKHLPVNARSGWFIPAGGAVYQFEGAVLLARTLLGFFASICF